MADNRIVHRVSLEGDADVKSRLKSVEDAMKRLDATNASGGNGVGGAVEGPLKSAAETGGKLRGMLAPVLGEINAATSGLVDGIGSIFGKLRGVLTSPLGNIGILAAARLQMAQLGDETRRAELRIKALGGGAEGFTKLNASSKTLGVSRDVLQPGLEQFLADFSRNRRQLQMIGGGGPAGLVDFKPDVDEFLTSQRALFYGARAGGIPTDQAKAAIETFRSSITAQGGLTSDILAQLPAAMGNRLAQASSPLASGIGGFRDAGDFGRYLDVFGPIPEKSVNRLLAADEPSAKAAADAARGVSDAFEGLRAAAGRLAEAFGTRNNENIIKLIDSITRITNGMADNAGKFGSGAGANTLGDVFGGKDGDLMGRLATYLANHLGDAADFAANGPKFLQQTPKNTLQKFMDTTAIGKALTNAATNPGALKDPRDESQIPVIAPRRQPAPSIESSSPSDVWIADPNAPDGMRKTTIPTAAGSEIPVPPAAEVVPPQSLEQRSDASDGATQSLAALDSTATKANASLDKFATDLAAILDRIGGAAPTKAARGGLISGSGTSTSDSIPALLSDKEYVVNADATAAIGADMLDALNFGSRGGGLARLRRMIHGYADGGIVSADGRRVTYDRNNGIAFFDGIRVDESDPGYDAGAVAAAQRKAEADYQRDQDEIAEGYDLEEQRRLKSGPVGEVKQTLADLGPGDHQIAFDPSSGGAIIDGVQYSPGHPLLDDPTVRQELAASAAAMNQGSSRPKYKSLFVGGWGQFGTHADGGPISGPGTSRSDSIPAMLSDGEFVVNAGAARKHLGLLHAINGGRKIGLSHFALGGPVGLLGNVGLPQVNTPDIANAGGASEALHHVTIAMPDGREVGGLRAPRDVIRALEREAITSVNAEIGRKPSWVRGR